MMSCFFILAALGTGATFVSAQLSSGCTTALAQVAANPDAAACLSPSSLIPLFVGSGNTSIVDPINTWLTNICAAAPCSNATLSAVVTTVASGCSTDLPSLGSGSTATVIQSVQQMYPTVRKVVCLKDGNTNCITQTLTNAQNILGPLSINKIIDLVANPLTSLPGNITCTNCTKAAYNIINQDIPSLGTADASDLQAQCGSSFTDGTTPVGISQSASSAGAAGASGAALGTVLLTSSGALAGMGASALVALSFAFFP